MNNRAKFNDIRFFALVFLIKSFQNEMITSVVLIMLFKVIFFRINNRNCGTTTQKKLVLVIYVEKIYYSFKIFYINHFLFKSFQVKSLLFINHSFRLVEWYWFDKLHFVIIDIVRIYYNKSVLFKNIFTFFIF